jgi:formyl-CoA transferase
VQIPGEIVNDPQLLANQILVPIVDGGANPRLTVNRPVVINDDSKPLPDSCESAQRRSRG